MGLAEVAELTFVLKARDEAGAAGIMVRVTPIGALAHGCLSNE